MPLRYKARILKRLQTLEEKQSQIRALAEELRVEEADYAEFEQAVRQMAAAGEVLFADETVMLPPPGEEVVGVFRGNPKGFGFLIPSNPNDHGDFFVPPDQTLDALTGDVVRARVLRKRFKGQTDYIASVIEIVDRKQSVFTGTLIRRGGQWMVTPDGKALHAPVVVKDPGAKNAKAGDKVVFEVLEFPEEGRPGEGVITKVLGEAGEPDVETQAVIAAHDLPGEFPESCLNQAREVSRAFEEEIDLANERGYFEMREDLRDAFIFTIDPPDARDFDDAISLEKVTHDDGRPGWKLGIHIADVSHFVTPGSPLDEEAKERGNSVYLPRRVIPMLPELLSNGVCSLQERVPRFCKSAFIRYDERGNVTGRGYSSTVIHSAKRLTYLEAQALIEGDEEEAKKHAKTEPEYSDELKRTLAEANRLSKIIHARRHKTGMIHLDLPEVELVFDRDGRVVDAEPEDDAWTHTLIEMFMVEANEAVAVLFERLGVPALRRTHPDPDPSGFENLRKFVKAAGYSVRKDPDRFDIQQLLDATKGTPAAPAIHFAVLRCLTKAEYSPAHIGHYALASSAYSHFTSPIRRYPDLTIHRALSEFLKRTNNGDNPPQNPKSMKNLGREMCEAKNCPPEGDLVQVASRCNRTEENATEAERSLRNFLVMQLLEEHIGEVFQGVVTGVTNAGVFVRINKYLVEGLVKTSDLPMGKPGAGSGRWKVDDRTGALVEASTGRSYRLGDQVQVCVSQVNLAARQMELLIPDEEAQKRAGVGKALKLGEAGGGIGEAGGAGFGAMRTGSQRRSAKSKRRDKGKADHRKDKKDKGKRQ
jgi:ribonuclease R